MSSNIEATKKGTETKDQLNAVVQVSSGELATKAQSDQLRAQIEAACILAERHPRNIAQVRINILEACKRKRFAENALYRLPIGTKNIIGFSIRFAELAVNEWGNILSLLRNVFEDEEKRLISALTMDVEKNLTISKEAVVEKTVERSEYTAKDREILDKRTNSKGKLTCIVKALDNEVRSKQNSEESKLLRDQWLRFIPQDIKEEAFEIIQKTLTGAYKENLKEEINRITDAFAEIGIKPIEIEKYIGHSMDTVSPAEITDMRGVYQSIRDGVATWKDFVSTPKDNSTDNDPLNTIIDEELKKTVQPQKQPVPDQEQKAEQKGVNAKQKTKHANSKIALFRAWSKEHADRLYQTALEDIKVEKYGDISTFDQMEQFINKLASYIEQSKNYTETQRKIIEAIGAIKELGIIDDPVKYFKSVCKTISNNTDIKISDDLKISELTPEQSDAVLSCILSELESVKHISE